MSFIFHQTSCAAAGRALPDREALYWEVLFLREFFGNPREVFKLRNLTVIALLLALRVLLGFLTIQITPEFRFFSLTFIPMAMVAYLYGPWAGLLFGLLGDTLGFIVRPLGVYFIGFAISEATICFIYACFTYKRPVDSMKSLILRVTLARICIAVFVFFGLNYIWFSVFGHLFGVPPAVREAGAFFIASGRLINNIFLLPIYVGLSVFFIRLARRLEDLRYSGT